MNVLQLTKTLTSAPDAISLSGYIVRDYRGAEDIDSWLDIRQQAFRNEQPGARHWSRAEFEAEMLSGGGFAPTCIWFAEQEVSSQPVGTVSLARRRGDGGVHPVVHWLAVVPKWRRLGIGRLLMAHLERYCWDHRMTDIGVETHKGWCAAVQLYGALGYR